MTPDSPTLRERRAQLTHDEILRAARRLFAEHGYARTSVRDIAKAAGVSAQTVYDSVGSKQQLVAQLNDLIDAEAGIGAIVRRRPAVRGPAGGRGDLGPRRALDPRALRGHHPRARHRRRGRAGARRRAGGGPAAPRRRRHHGRRPPPRARGAGRPRRGRDARGRLRRALRARAAGELRLVAGPARALDRPTPAPRSCCAPSARRARRTPARGCAPRRRPGRRPAPASRARPPRARGRPRPRGRRRPSDHPSTSPIRRAAGSAEDSPRSKVSIEIRVRRASTSSRWCAPSWAAAYQASTCR